MVHPGGRPRTVTPEKEELIELGKDLVAWASEKTKELRCRYCQWYSSKGILRREWQHMREKEEFHVYYEQARTLLCQKFLDGSVNASIAHRYLRIYDPDLKQEEDETKDKDSERKKSEADVIQDILVKIIDYKEKNDVKSDRDNSTS